MKGELLLRYQNIQCSRLTMPRMKSVPVERPVVHRSVVCVRREVVGCSRLAIRLAAQCLLGHGVAIDLKFEKMKADDRVP